jgi:catechol 2,3-dioxygenase-like lactoylglutathione lyase family enzyme
MGMAVTGYHHIGLWVENLDRSLKFYTEGLGAKEVFSFPMGDSGKRIHMVDVGGGAIVEIIPKGKLNAEANARWAHIAVASTDAKADYERLIEAGATTDSAPEQIVLGGTMKVCNAFVKGPDGETIEVFQALN